LFFTKKDREMLDMLERQNRQTQALLIAIVDVLCDNPKEKQEILDLSKIIYDELKLS
jgi:hypothetical protein